MNILQKALIIAAGNGDVQEHRDGNLYYVNRRGKVKLAYPKVWMSCFDEGWLRVDFDEYAAPEYSLTLAGEREYEALIASQQPEREDESPGNQPIEGE